MIIRLLLLLLLLISIAAVGSSTRLILLRGSGINRCISCNTGRRTQQGSSLRTIMIRSSFGVVASLLWSAATATATAAASLVVKWVIGGVWIVNVFVVFAFVHVTFYVVQKYTDGGWGRMLDKLYTSLS